MLNRTSERGCVRRGRRAWDLAGRTILLLLVWWMISSTTFGQAFPIFNGTASTCTGAFLDSGGQGAGGYSNNENITYTLCPDAPGGAISLNLLTFILSTAGAAPIDKLSI